MTDYSQLVKTLRSGDDFEINNNVWQAADAIEALEARVAELEAGLRDLLDLTDDPANGADPCESTFTHCRALLERNPS